MAEQATTNKQIQTNTIQTLGLDQIDEPVQPMRAGLEMDKLNELADSIRANGLINPITVRPKGDRFEVVAGHRRFRACAIAGIFRIPCVVADIDDSKAFDIMAAENLNRQDVNPVEEAMFLQRLVGEDDTKIPDVAVRVNRSIDWVQARLELLHFSEAILSALAADKIKLGVAQWLGRIDDLFWQAHFLNQALGQGMSVLQARYCHDQYAMGVLPKADDIMPSNDELGGTQPQVKVECAKCGKVTSLFQTVFIHQGDCPVEDQQLNNA